MFTRDGELVRLETWSCGGHPRFLPIVQQLYQNVHAACLVYDVTNPNSLKRCNFWRNEALRAFPEAVLYLVGTKCDLSDMAQVTVEDARAQAEQWEISHVLVSAKTGENIDTFFDELLFEVSDQNL